MIHRQNGYTYVIIVYIIRNFKKHLLNRFQIFALHEPAIYQERRNILKLYGLISSFVLEKKINSLVI